MGEVAVAVGGREVVGLMRPSVGGNIMGVLKSRGVTKLKSRPASSLGITAYHPPRSTYSSSISTDIPLYETDTPTASFDHYLEDKPRVFRAMFPDKQRSHRLNEEEWRVHMLPIEFLFMTVIPVVDMRLTCKTSGKEYPAGISPAISKVLELDIVRWELQGLDDAAKPTQFNLGVKGALYPDRRGLRTRLKGQLEMKISVILPPMLALVPQYMLTSVSETVLRKLVENMKDKVNSSLLADYSEFRRERQMDTIKN